LSQRCFGAPGWRVNNDIDMLIDVEDMPRAHALITASQYDRVQPLGDLSPEEIDRDLKRRKDWVYVKRQDRIILEVHHRLFDNVRLCTPGMMDRTEPLKLFDQVEVAVLSPEDELPYLALHGAMHAWSRLKWLIDFAILLRQRSPEDIDTMLRQAKGGPAGHALHQGIALCWRLFAPDTAEPRMFRSRRTGILAAAAIRALTAEGSRELEDTRLGTTIKSASHYLLWSNPSYLISELGYDLTETSQDGEASNSSLPIWLQRPVRWARRRAFAKN
jgi:putative nucleotidyltransferase-like protein